MLNVGMLSGDEVNRPTDCTRSTAGREAGDATIPDARGQLQLLAQHELSCSLLHILGGIVTAAGVPDVTHQLRKGSWEGSGLIPGFTVRSNICPNAEVDLSGISVRREPLVGRKVLVKSSSPFATKGSLRDGLGFLSHFVSL
jgi:hypothetical protein